MPSKKPTKPETAEETKAAPKIALGRPAFASNVIPNTDADLERPAGAVEMLTSNAKPAKAGSPTLTLHNPTPTAAAPTASPSPKRG